MTSEEANYSLFVEKRSRLSPLIVPRVMPNAGASHITMEFGLHGPAFTIATACSSSTHAYWAKPSGWCDTEWPMLPSPVAARPP